MWEQTTAQALSSKIWQCLKTCWCLGRWWFPKESHCPSSGNFTSSASSVLYDGIFSVSDKFRQENPWRHHTQQEGQMAFYNSSSILNPAKSQEGIGADKTFSVYSKKVLLGQSGNGTSWHVNIWLGEMWGWHQLCRGFDVLSLQSTRLPR